MTVLLGAETQSAVRDFLLGVLSPGDFERWIIAAEDDLPETERTQLWEIRLLLTEYAEKLRPLEDARERAASMLAAQGELMNSDSGSRTMEFPTSSLASTSG